MPAGLHVSLHLCHEPVLHVLLIHLVDTLPADSDQVCTVRHRVVLLVSLVCARALEIYADHTTDVRRRRPPQQDVVLDGQRLRNIRARQPEAFLNVLTEQTPELRERLQVLSEDLLVSPQSAVISTSGLYNVCAADPVMHEAEAPTGLVAKMLVSPHPVDTTTERTLTLVNRYRAECPITLLTKSEPAEDLHAMASRRT